MLQENDPQNWRYSGELTRQNVTAQWKQLKSRRYAKALVSVDLSGLLRVDSAGLAMLICWQSQVKKSGGELRFIHIPAQLAKLIQVADLNQRFNLTA